MQTRWILTLALALGMAATPALAGHRHRSGCGHAYSRAHGGWVSVNVATPHFGFSFSRAPRYDRYYGDRYYRDRYDDDRYYGSPYGGRYGGYSSWDPYRYDSRYDKHRGYWKGHHGHRHGYRDRHCH
jgi:hypothetical protein